VKRREILQGEGGFTLVEIAITIAIIGIVAMLAVPSIIGVMPRLRLGNDAMTLGNEIALSRARAIAKNHEFRIAFDAGGDTYRLRNNTLGVNITTNKTTGGIDLYQVENLAPSDQLAMRPVGTVGLVNGSGDYEALPLGTVARIYLQTDDTNYRKRIVVEATGRVGIERWTGGATWVEE